MGRVDIPRRQSLRFDWQHPASFPQTVWLDPASVAEPAASVFPFHHGKHLPPDWKKKTAFPPELTAI
jgi:hypothetical protein